MPARDENPAPRVDPDPSKTTRREALRDALRPGAHLDGHRAYSTLVQRREGPLSEPNDCRYCATLLHQVMNHLTGHVILDDFPPGYEALLAAVDAFPAHRGGAPATPWPAAPDPEALTVIQLPLADLDEEDPSASPAEGSS